MKKVIKTTTTRTVIPSVSDTLSLDGGGSVTGMGGYTTPVGYRQGPGVVVPSTVPRNYHYGPPVGYGDYRAGPPSDAYASLNRSAHMDDRYRWVDLHLLGGAMGLRRESPDCSVHLNLQACPPGSPRRLQNPGSKLQSS